MKVNGVVTNYGMVNIENGNSETKVKSSVPLKTGDNVQFRYRSICSCCDNVTPTSGWSAWGGTNIVLATTGQGLWDDVWKAVPISWQLIPTWDYTSLYYKITKDGKLIFRGSVTFSEVIPTTLVDAVSINPFTLLNIPTAIYNNLNISTLNATNNDYFSGGTIRYISSIDTFYIVEAIWRNGNDIKASITSRNKSGTISSAVIHTISMSHISIK